MNLTYDSETGLLVGGVIAVLILATWQAAGMSFAITLMGFAGGLIMSAIKRDRGVKDYGTLIKGHGGCWIESTRFVFQRRSSFI